MINLISLPEAGEIQEETFQIYLSLDAMVACKTRDQKQIWLMNIVWLMKLPPPPPPISGFDFWRQCEDWNWN